MSRSIFGWDLPPGCSHRDIERAMGGDAREPSPLEENIWEAIEEAGLPVEVNEKVADVLDQYYASLSPPDQDGVEDPPKAWPEGLPKDIRDIPKRDEYTGDDCTECDGTGMFHGPVGSESSERCEHCDGTGRQRVWKPERDPLDEKDNLGESPDY
jgi:hypothetical protein